MAASGRSSWKLVSEKATKGAVAKKNAARRPVSASQSARPSAKMAARATPRNASITACAVRGTLGNRK